MQLALTSNASTDQTMDENRTKWTIIFSPKICDNVDLLVGNMIHIFPPWYASSFLYFLYLLLFYELVLLFHMGLFVVATIDYSFLRRMKLFFHNNKHHESN
jgi:hypothetical protein